MNDGPYYAQQQQYDLPTQDERTMAMLAHLLQVFTGFLAPLIIFLLKKDQSRFVAYHALQALLWQCLMFVVMMVVMFGGVICIAAFQFRMGPGFPVGFLFIWGFIMLTGALNLILGIFYTIKAYNGEWAAYPIIGDWAKKILR